MNLTDTEILKFQRGSPVLLDDICAIYPLTLGEIADVGYDKFQLYLGILTSEKPTDIKGEHELVKLLNDLSDFQYLLMMTAIDKQSNETFRDAFQLFCKEDVFFSLDPPQIVVGPPEEKRILDEQHFYDLQHILKRMYWIEQDGEEIVINADDSLAVRNLKLQMKKNRERVRKAKANRSRQEGHDLKFSDLIGSLTINNCGLNMENIWNITYYAFHDQLKRMGWRDQFNINQSAALAGAKLKKSQLKHWMRTIGDSEKS